MSRDEKRWKNCNARHLKLDQASDERNMYVFYFEACYIKP